MRTETTPTQIIIRLSHDEAIELADDNVWDDADAFAITSRLGECIRDAIPSDDEDDIDDCDDNDQMWDDSDESDDGSSIEPPAPDLR